MARNDNTPANYREYERFRAWVNTLERFRLGDAIMDLSGYTAADIVTAFHDSDFTDPLHRAVFRAVSGLVKRGARDLDVGLVVGELQRQGTFSEFPNAVSYVASLSEGVVPPPTRDSRLFRLHELAWA